MIKTIYTRTIELLEKQSEYTAGLLRVAQAVAVTEWFRECYEKGVEPTPEEVDESLRQLQDQLVRKLMSSKGKIVRKRSITDLGVLKI